MFVITSNFNFSTTRYLLFSFFYVVLFYHLIVCFVRIAYLFLSFLSFLRALALFLSLYDNCVCHRFHCHTQLAQISTGECAALLYGCLWVCVYVTLRSVCVCQKVDSPIVWPVGWQFCRYLADKRTSWWQNDTSNDCQVCEYVSRLRRGATVPYCENIPCSI